MKAVIRFKGGPGSGNFGHSGRPGHVGGSGGGGGKISEENELAFVMLKLEPAIAAGIIQPEMASVIAKKAVETTELYGQPTNSAAANSYTNSAFRYGSTRFRDENKYSQPLQQEILKSAMPVSEIVYRGIGGRHAKDMAALSVGSEVTLQGHFTGVSRSQDIANMFGVDGGGITLTIQVTKGQPGLYISAETSEILLPGNSTFKKIGVDAFEYIGYVDG